MSNVRTPAQLAVRVASSMNLLRPGEDLSARYEAQFIDAYHELYAELIDDRIAYWPRDEIPLAVFQRIAWMVALQVAPAFGAMPILLTALSEQSSGSARETQRDYLLRHIAKDPHYETLKIDYM
jgi:hypothetical protein